MSWTAVKLRGLLSEIAYKPGWRFRIHNKGDGFLLQPVFYCAKDEEQKGRKWYVSSHATKSEVVQTVFKSILTAEEHETREQFLFRGLPIMNPHLPVDNLHSFLDGLELDKRPTNPLNKK